MLFTQMEIDLKYEHDLNTSNINKFYDHRYESMKSDQENHFHQKFQDSITHIQSYIVYKIHKFIHIFHDQK